MNKLEAWVKKRPIRLMWINLNNVIHVGRENTCHNYLQNEKTLRRTDMKKDVGVLIDSKLNCSNQGQAAAAK